MQSRKRDRAASGLWETVRTIIYAVLIAVAIRTVLFEPFNIPSGSMIPTLLVGDYLFVSKYSYGYSRHSLPFSLPLFSGRIFNTPPKRGDVAVFKLPKDNKTDYIKRLVGLPGDRIRVTEGRLYINDALVERKRIESYVDPGARGPIIPITQYDETLPGGRIHRIIERSDNGPADNTQTYTVPPGHYFAMGDNRDNSLDSRALHDVGFIPAENLVGRAEIIFFSTNGSASWWEFWKWPRALRFNRFFMLLNE